MKRYTSLLVLVIMTASCTHVYYAPNTANAPLLSEKGETRINALYSAGGVSEFSGGELQVAHAIGKNFGLMVNGMAVSRSDEITDWDFNSGTTASHTEKGNGSYIEFAGGYFTTLDKSKKIVFETYGGFGAGSAKNDYDFGDYSKVNSAKIFIQPSIGYRTNYFEMAVVPKVSFINWNIKEKRISNQGNSDAGEIVAIESKPHFVAFEPALLLRAGGKDFKAQASLSFSNTQSSSGSGYRTDDLIEGLNASIGISINLRPNKK
jgi:hypothetical protein